eukprot:11620468-Karenia_brevis.AAC.1
MAASEAENIGSATDIDQENIVAADGEDEEHAHFTVPTPKRARLNPPAGKEECKHYFRPHWGCPGKIIAAHFAGIGRKLRGKQHPPTNYTPEECIPCTASVQAERIGMPGRVQRSHGWTCNQCFWCDNKALVDMYNDKKKQYIVKNQLLTFQIFDKEKGIDWRTDVIKSLYQKHKDRLCMALLKYSPTAEIPDIDNWVAGSIDWSGQT